MSKQMKETSVFHAMCRKMAMLTCAMLATDALAEEVAPSKVFDGYSYATLGLENITYQEMLSLAPVVSKVSASNVSLRTGGLFNLTPALDFSLDTGTTLLEDIVREDWRARGGTAYQQALPDPSTTIVQSNDFSFSASSVLALLHWKHSNHFRSVYGVNYDSFSFRRYNFNTTQNPAIVLPVGAIEETSVNVSLAGGVAYESAGLARERSRVQLRALLQLPVWHQATNTNVPGVTFSDASGLAVQLSGSWSWRFYRGLEAGVAASYGWRQQDSQRQRSGAAVHELPENELTHAFVGLQLGWNLSRPD